MPSRRPAHRTASCALLAFLAWSACRDAATPPAPRPADPAPPAAATAPAAPPVADPAQDADGERRATAAGADLIGQPAPTFTLTTIDDRQIRLTGERPVYLKFWATWCVPCRAQMPGFADIHARLGDRLEVIAVNTGFGDDMAAVRAYKDEHGLRMPVVVDDGRLATAFNLRVTPQHVLIGRDGRIAHVGHVDDARLHAAISAVLSADGGPAELAPEPANAPAIRPGDPVPDLTLTALDGTTVPLRGALRGLVFFAPWCESYLAESRPNTAQACRRVREAIEPLAIAGGPRWLAVASNLWATDADLKDYAATTDTQISLALDTSGEVFRAFGVRDIPAVVTFDADGRVARVIDADAPDLAAALTTLAVP